jgi:hypothetical protein
VVDGTPGGRSTSEVSGRPCDVVYVVPGRACDVVVYVLDVVPGGTSSPEMTYVLEVVPCKS